MWKGPLSVSFRAAKIQEKDGRGAASRRCAAGQRRRHRGWDLDMFFS